MADIFSLSSSIDSLVQQYRVSLRKPVSALEGRKTNINARLSVLAELRSRLGALNITSKGLKVTGASSTFLAYTVESSLATVATANATSSASVGSHTLFVTQLAKADSVLSSRLTSAATSIVDAEHAGEKVFRVTVNGQAQDVHVMLADGDTNSSVLSKIASAVNASTAGVTASVVSDTSTTSRLVFTSKATGSEQAVGLQDQTGSLLSAIGLSADVISSRRQSGDTDAGYLYSSASLLDATFELDGIHMTRGTNTVSNALAGVTFDLKAVQRPGDSPVVLNVKVDTAKIKGEVEKFLKQYNDALTYLTSKTSVNPQAHTREILSGDTDFRNLRISLRTIAGGRVEGIQEGNPSLLSDIGITVATDGTLSIGDSTRFENAVATNASKVADLFNSTNGVAARLTTVLENFVSSGGHLDLDRDAANDQITSLNTRVERLNSSIEIRVGRFRDEFTKLQGLLAKVSQQQQMVQQLTSQLYG